MLFVTHERNRFAIYGAACSWGGEYTSNGLAERCVQTVLHTVRVPSDEITTGRQSRCSYDEFGTTSADMNHVLTKKCKSVLCKFPRTALSPSSKHASQKHKGVPGQRMNPVKLKPHSPPRLCQRENGNKKESTADDAHRRQRNSARLNYTLSMKYIRTTVTLLSSPLLL